MSTIEPGLRVDENAARRRARDVGSVALPRPDLGTSARYARKLRFRGREERGAGRRRERVFGRLTGT